MLKIAYHPIYKHHLPDGHRFPMVKYELLLTQLLYEGTCIASNFFEPSVIDDVHVLECHTEAYFNNLKRLSINPREARK